MKGKKFMNCRCKKTNFYFITSFEFNEENVTLGTNQPINADDFPSCFTARISRCIEPVAGAENYEMQVAVNGVLVPILNRYGTPMKYGELILSYGGCLDRRFTYVGYISKASARKTQVLLNNAPKYIAS